MTDPMFLRVATQEERRAETRRRLLEAAAELFAERGSTAPSVDAIAERADRTSGAVYDHFGGKEGLLFALLDGWVDDVSRRHQRRAGHRDHPRRASRRPVAQRLGARWRANGRWIALEHELWTYAARATPQPVSTWPAATAAPGRESTEATGSVDRTVRATWGQRS